MNKDKILLFYILILLSLLTSCDSLFWNQRSERATIVQQNLEQSIGGSYTWIKEEKINKNTYIEYFYSSISPDNNLCAILDITSQTFDLMTYDIYSDYNCKFFAEREKALYEDVLKSYFTKYKAIPVTKGRFSSFIPNIEDTEECFRTYIEQCRWVSYTEENFLVDNPTDVYIIVGEQNKYDVQYMKSFLSVIRGDGKLYTYPTNYEKHLDITNNPCGYFCFVSDDKADLINTIIETQIEKHNWSNFSSVYRFDCRLDYKIIKEK